jgi:hypothetical protein
VGTTVATVSLENQTASLGSAASPVTIFTVGGADAEFAIQITVNCVVPITMTLNSQGAFAGVMLTFVFGWMNQGSPPFPWGGQFSAEAFSNDVSLDNGQRTGFSAVAGTSIWYYTTWTVDSALPPGSFYNLSIALEQLSP